MQGWDSGINVCCQTGVRGDKERSKGGLVELGLRSRKVRFIWTVTRETVVGMALWGEASTGCAGSVHLVEMFRM